MASLRALLSHLAPLALVCFVLPLSACGPKAKSLAFAKPLVIDKLEGVTLPTPKALDADGNEVVLDKPFKWAPPVGGVVELVGDKLTPLKNGETRLAVTVEGTELASELTVQVQVVTGVVVSCPKQPCIARVGETLQLAAEVSGLGGPVNAAPTWESSDPKVATVAGDKVTALAPGKATIVVKAGKNEGSVAVDVRAAVQEVRLYCPSPFMVVTAKPGEPAAAPTGQVCVIAPTGTRMSAEVVAGGEVSTTEEVLWEVNDVSLASVAAGLVMPVKEGVTMMRAKSGELVAEMPIELGSKQKKVFGACSLPPESFARHTTVAFKPVVGGVIGNETALTFQCESDAGTACLEAAVKETPADRDAFGGFSSSPLARAAFGARCCCK